MSDLGREVTQGLVWSIAERIVTQVALFAISMILARILSPTEYGVIAMLLVFVNLADILVTNGLGEALIQRKAPTKQDYSSICFCGLIMSVFLYVVIFVSAPIIEAFYDQENLTILLRVLALRLPLSSLYAIQRAYVAKNFLFKMQFAASSSASFLAGLTAIVMACAGFGVWALVVQQLVTVLLSSAAMLLVTRWFPGLRPNWISVIEILPSGIQLALANMVNGLYTEGRSLILGKACSPTELALFNRGNQFPALIINNLNAPIGNVMLSAMAEVADDSVKLKDSTRKAIKMINCLVAPLLALLAVAASPLVEVLLTEKWLGCVPFLQLACLFFLFQPAQTMNWQAIKAAGRSDLCLKLELIKKALGFLILFASIPFGAMAIAVSSALFGFVSMLINIIPNKGILGYSVSEQLKDMAKPVIIALVANIPSALLIMLGLSAIITLILQVFASLLISFVLLKLTKEEGFEMLWQVLRSKMGNRQNGK